MFRSLTADYETVPKFISRDDESVEHPELSVAWRLTHCLLCILGGVAFSLGSLQYFPNVDHHTLGGWLFTLGSGGFLIADLLDLFINHIGTILTFGLCSFDTTAKISRCCINGESNEFSVHKRNRRNVAQYQSQICAQNAVLTTTGSLCYFVGCILFIPFFREELIGDVIFIPGSIIIVVSMMWKIYRTGCEGDQEHANASCEIEEGNMLESEQESGNTGALLRENNSASKHFFTWTNLVNSNLLVLGADASLCLGSVAFLVGAVMFLPVFDKNDDDTVWACVVFVVGSMFFISNGCFMFCVYFCSA